VVSGYKLMFNLLFFLVKKRKKMYYFLELILIIYVSHAEVKFTICQNWSTMNKIQDFLLVN
jgi:hypothetical protein